MYFVTLTEKFQKQDEHISIELNYKDSQQLQNQYDLR